MIGEDFKFGSTKLSDFQMFMAAPEEEQEFVTREIDKGEITPKRARPNHYGITYEDALKLNFLIMKEDGCSKQEDFVMTGSEINDVRAWLESPKLPTELTMISRSSDPEEESGESGVGEGGSSYNTYSTGDDVDAPTSAEVAKTFYYGVFTSVQPYIIDGDCYGLKLEFTCDSPYGYSEESVEKLIGSITEEAVTVNNNSAEMEECIRPTIVIYSSNEFGSSESLSITNTTDGDKEMSITLPPGLSMITIDCDKKIVTDEDGNLVPLCSLGITTPVSSEYNLISTDTVLLYWLSLVDGENVLSLVGSSGNSISKIEIKSRFILKTGGF